MPARLLLSPAQTAVVAAASCALAALVCARVAAARRRPGSARRMLEMQSVRDTVAQGAVGVGPAAGEGVEVAVTADAAGAAGAVRL